MRLEGAEPLATYSEGFYAGTPAATRHRFGDGLACYVGTRLADGYLSLLLWRTCRDAGIHVDLDTPPGVEVVRRKTGLASFLFLLNHNDAPAELQPPASGRDLLSGHKHEASVTLEPLGVVVLEEDD